MQSEGAPRVRRKVQRPLTRAAVPKSAHPNFRDHGMCVEAPLLRLLTNLQAVSGESYASEAGARRMLCQDTGHMPGMDTVRRALSRLDERGAIRMVYLKPGDVMPNGERCRRGTRLVLVPRNRGERRALVATALARRRRRKAAVTLDEARAQLRAGLESWAPRKEPTAEEMEAFERELRAREGIDPATPVGVWLLGAT